MKEDLQTATAPNQEVRVWQEILPTGTTQPTCVYDPTASSQRIMSERGQFSDLKLPIRRDSGKSKKGSCLKGVKS